MMVVGNVVLLWSFIGDDGSEIVGNTQGALCNRCFGSAHIGTRLVGVVVSRAK